MASRDDTVTYTHLRLAKQLGPIFSNFSGVSRLISNHRSFASSQACKRSGSFAPPALPSIDAHVTLSDSRLACRACYGIGVATCDQNGSPPITRLTIMRQKLTAVLGLPRVFGQCPDLVDRGRRTVSAFSRFGWIFLEVRVSFVQCLLARFVLAEEQPPCAPR